MDTATEERFWRKVDRSGGQTACWPWTACLFRNQYGCFSLDGRNVKSHRVAYLLCVGQIPDGHLVCHHCDNRPCCNPAHLFTGTTDDNMADMVAKGRSARGERHISVKCPERLARGDRNGSVKHPESRPRGEANVFHQHPEFIPRGDAHWTRLRPNDVLSGERNGNARLTAEQVIEMRALHAAGIGAHRLGKKFAVHKSTAQSILRHESWKHIG